MTRGLRNREHFQVVAGLLVLGELVSSSRGHQMQVGVPANWVPRLAGYLALGFWTAARFQRH